MCFVDMSSWNRSKNCGSKSKNVQSLLTNSSSTWVPRRLSQQLNLTDLCQQREEEKKQQQIENEAKRNDEKRRVELFANAILSRGIQEEKKKVLFFSVFLLMIRHYCSPSTSHSFSPWDLQKQPVP